MDCGLKPPLQNRYGGRGERRDRGRLDQPSLPTTGNSAERERIMLFCETNPPVKRRIMNRLGDWGVEDQTLRLRGLWGAPKAFGVAKFMMKTPTRRVGLQLEAKPYWFFNNALDKRAGRPFYLKREL